MHDLKYFASDINHYFENILKETCEQFFQSMNLHIKPLNPIKYLRITLNPWMHIKQKDKCIHQNIMIHT